MGFFIRERTTHLKGVPQLSQAYVFLKCACSQDFLVEVSHIISQWLGFPLLNEGKLACRLIVGNNVAKFMNELRKELVYSGYAICLQRS